MSRSVEVQAMQRLQRKMVRNEDLEIEGTEVIEEPSEDNGWTMTAEVEFTSGLVVVVQMVGEADETATTVLKVPDNESPVDAAKQVYDVAFEAVVGQWHDWANGQGVEGLFELLVWTHAQLTEAHQKIEELQRQPKLKVVR